MSLRARILLSIFAVNLAVAALLGVYLVSDLKGRDRAKRAAEEERARILEAKFEQAFDGYLSVDATGEERTVAEAVRVLRHHRVRNFVKDGVVLQVGVASGTPLSFDPDTALPAQALYMNLPGAKHRAPTFDDRRARARIREAINLKRNVRETDPALKGWVAAPIRLGKAGESAAAAPIWGGGYFLLDLPEEEEWVPGFQPGILLIGMGAGTLILLALTWLLLERFVLRPLADLTAGAERVARREYGAEVPGPGDDEIGRVVATFNSMMTQVRDAERNLTLEVERATRRAEERGRGLVIAQRLAATGTLASGIAHEINNPLGGMLNAALRLKQEAEKESAGSSRKRYLELLVDGLTRVQGIVKRVLHFTPRRVEPAVVSVLDLVRHAVAFTEHRAKQAKVTITVGGEDASVLAEPGEMQQVFLNLLLNACDAMAERGGRVAVSSRVQEGKVAVAVADDGPGMTPEEQERCFDLFFTTKEAGRGTGLGLSVAHHIVEQHGGTITVASEPGRGAIFTVTLPLARGTPG
jgi:signal transduction histidine kinase